jgi:hypothetical protein
MELLVSAELFKDAGAAYRRTSAAVKRYLLRSFSESSALSSLPVTVRYIPIIMPDQLRERYPPRSRLRAKERLYDCAPQLIYDTFVCGTFEQQIEEYIRGLSESVPHLEKLGATAEQVAQYETILRQARDVILRDELDQTRH